MDGPLDGRSLAGIRRARPPRANPSAQSSGVGLPGYVRAERNRRTIRRTKVSEGLLLRNARERALWGCVTTWQNADARTLCMYRSGPPRRGLLSAIEAVMSLDLTFRLVSYSTPETVYRDLV